MATALSDITEPSLPPYKADPTAAKLYANERPVTWGLTFVAHTYEVSELRDPCNRLRRDLCSALEGSGAYVYPYEYLHITMSSVAPFTHTRLQEPGRTALEHAWADAVLSHVVHHPAWPRAPFPLIYHSLKLEQTAAFFMVQDPTGAVGRIREIIKEVAALPSIAAYAAEAQHKTPGIIHSTIMRFTRRPSDAPEQQSGPTGASMSDEEVKAKFEAVACTWQPVTIMADALLFIRERVPYMHLDIGPGLAGRPTAGVHEGKDRDCIVGAYPYKQY